MTKDQALTLALDVIKSSRLHCDAELNDHDVQTVITAIEQALSQDDSVVGTKTWFENGKLITQNLTAKDIYKESEQQEPVAYLAWRDGKPCYEGDDAVCEDAVWPVDGDDDRESMPVFTHPAPKQPWPDNCGSSHCSCVECVAPLSPKHAQVMEQALEALELERPYLGPMPSKTSAAITALKEVLE